MKKGDLVIKITENSKFTNKIKKGEFATITKGPYEKNMTDLILKEHPWLSSVNKVHEIKKVVDLLKDGVVYKYCPIEDFERVKK